jgi:serine/threonine protein kinase
VSAIPLRRLEGKYEILEKLREGGMGAIYKVRHRLLDEVCVIKVMRPQLVEDEELRARFLREARLAIKLRHANIAQLYDFTIDEDGTAFIVMEFISGMTFEDVLAHGGPPPLGLTSATCTAKGFSTATSRPTTSWSPRTPRGSPW